MSSGSRHLDVEAILQASESDDDDYLEDPNAKQVSIEVSNLSLRLKYARSPKK